MKRICKSLIIVSIFIGMQWVATSCEWLSSGGGGLLPPDKGMEFLGTIHENGIITLCHIKWEKDKAPVITPIQDIEMGNGCHPGSTSQAGQTVLIATNTNRMEQQYHVDGKTHGYVPIILNLKNMEWRYMSMPIPAEENYNYGLTGYPILSPDGKTIYYCYNEHQYRTWIGNSYLMYHDVSSGKNSGFEFKAYKKEGAQNITGRGVSLHALSPDGRYIIGSVNETDYGGFSGWGGGGYVRLFCHKVGTDDFKYFRADYKGTPSCTYVTLDSKYVYFSHYGYGYSKPFKYEIATGKITEEDESLKGLRSNSSSNYIQVMNDGILRDGGVVTVTNGKATSCFFKNLT